MQNAEKDVKTTETAVVLPAMARDEIEAGLASHDRALYIREGWIRDPLIALGPDDYYYLTGTTSLPGDPREHFGPYNTGLGKTSIVGWKMHVWRSRDLIDWESCGTPFTLEDTAHYQQAPETFDEDRDTWRLWAPELHWIGERWALVHCPKDVSSLALTEGAELTGPWTHPMGRNLGEKHDPSLFKDDDGTWYLLSRNGDVQPLSDDFSTYAGPLVHLEPAGSRPGPDGTSISRIGHEGICMYKIGKKYVFIGTGWSTDQMRKGSYNLYCCTADNVTGPYGPRKFVGRFLGHGTPFKTRDGKWWCTAFYNANVPPVSRDGIETRDLSEDAQTINQRGTTIVPLDVQILADGDVEIRAKDPAYATPGPDEIQKF